MKTGLLTIALVSLSTATLAQQTITSPDAGEDHAFGTAISSDGNVALIGAPGAEGAEFQSGAAYAYRRTHGTWAPFQTLAPSDGERRDQFGSSISLQGEWAVVGAKGYSIDIGDNQVAFFAGAVYVYRLGDGGWSLHEVITNPDPARDDNFGHAVAVHGDVIAVGAPQDNEGSGGVYLYRFDGSVWQLEKTIEANRQTSGSLGNAVAMHDGLLVFGSRDGRFGSSWVHVYRWDGTDWLPEPVDRTIETFREDSFGFSMATDGTRIAVGAPGRDNAVVATGAAYVLQFDGTTWVEEAINESPSPEEQEGTGAAVAIRGSTLLAGAPFKGTSGVDVGGIAYLYSDTGAGWAFDQDFGPITSDAGDDLGRAVALGDDYALVAAPGRIVEEFRDAGVVYSVDAMVVSDVEAEVSGQIGMGVSVYPHPVADRASLSMQLDRPAPVAITIRDILGRVVSREEAWYSGGEVPLDFSAMPVGAFLFEIETPTGRTVRQVQVVR